MKLKIEGCKKNTGETLNNPTVVNTIHNTKETPKNIEPISFKLFVILSAPWSLEPFRYIPFGM